MVKLSTVITFIKYYCIPDLLFLVLALILWIFNTIGVQLSYIPIKYIFYSFLYLLGILSIYIKLYYWRQLPISMKSYIFFLATCTQFNLYLWSLYIIIFYLKKPIYLENLSVYSQYRYLLFSIITISIFLYIIISSSILSSSVSYQIFMSKITYPYLKEEIRVILYTWNDSIFGNVFSKLIEWLATSMRNRILYLVAHLLIFYSIRIIILILLFIFTFFKGDLCFILYLIPLSFFVWIMGFIEYYFQTFFMRSCNYINLLTKSSLIDEHKSSSFLGIIKTSGDNIKYELTPYAVSEKFTYEDLPSLGTTHLQLSRISAVFQWYTVFIRNLNFVLLFGQIINWFFIAYFSFLNNIIDIFSTIFLIRFWNKSQSLFRSHYATEAYFVKKQAQKAGEVASQGCYKKGHPIFADTAQKNSDDSSEVLFEGQATHGAG